MARKELSPEAVLQLWIDRDLSAAAANHELSPAFDVDDIVDELGELLVSGRCPLLIGERGVGKSAVIRELARRILADKGPPALAGVKILQISLQRQAMTVRGAHEVAQQFQSVVTALSRLPEKPLIVLQDVHIANTVNVEEQLRALACAVGHRLIGEAVSPAIESLLDDESHLEELFFRFRIEEPGIDRCTRILHRWRAGQTAQGRSYLPESVDEAVGLTQRFLSRHRQPRKSLDLLTQVGALKDNSEPIRRIDVIDRFCALHRTPRALLDPDMPLDLAELEQRFTDAVVGQEQAVKAVINMIGLVKAGLSDLRRPLGTFLFVGPTGVGKTHLAQLLAEYLFGTRERVVRLNMADYQADDDAQGLFGDPNDYRGPVKRGALTTRLLGHPFAVLLLDEFEKANKKIHDSFLQLIDEGQFINGLGESISCRSMIIIATSNAGASHYRGTSFGFEGNACPERIHRDMNRLIEHHFRIELLNRFDHVVHFRPLGREHMRAIALRELQGFQQRIGFKQRGLRLDVDEAVLDWLAVCGYDPEHGARHLRRTIDRQVSVAIAEAMIRKNPPMGSVLQLMIRDGEIAVHVVEGGTVSTILPTDNCNGPERQNSRNGSGRRVNSAGPGRETQTIAVQE